MDLQIGIIFIFLPLYFVQGNERPLKATFIADKPWISKANDFDETNPKYEGYLVDLAEEISKKINREIKFQEVKDGRYGSEMNEYFTVNGVRQRKFNGMVGEVQEREVDLALARITITRERSQVVSFVPFLSSQFNILIRKPYGRVDGITWSFYLAPFEFSTWLVILVITLVVMVLLTLINFLHHKNKTTNKDKNSETDPADDFGCKESCWIMCSTLSLQGYNKRPLSGAARVLTIFWCLFCILIFVSYISKFSQYTNVKRMVSPVKSLDDLLKQTGIRFGYISGGSTSKFFKNSKLKTMQRAHRMVENRTTIRTTQEGVKMVQQGVIYAFITEDTAVKYIVSRDCSLERLKPFGPDAQYGIALQPKSAYRKEIEMAILELKTEMVFQKLEEKWFIEKGMCSPQSRSYATPLSLDDFSTAIILVCIGIAVALLYLVAEMLCPKKLCAQKPTIV